MSRRYISINEAAEYLGISTKFVRNLIMEGEISGYRIGSYARHRTLRVDLDEIDEKLMRPIGPYWNDPSAKPRKRTSNSLVPGSLNRCRQNRPARQDALPLLHIRSPCDR
ncbi:MAG: DNA-binding protein excisionase family [Mycobacterium sp.]|nr:DNA-binding protein excisionase family [Mycobacterium sp.]